MPRALRPQIEGGIYHVNSVGVRRSDLFVDERTRAMFLAVLGVCVSKHSWTCGSYCLLRSHYHVLIKTAEANIGRGMQFLNGVYAQWFNKEYGYRGHAFESRYHSVVVESDDQLLRAARYIALNPVASGFCSAPQEWNWSSYPALIGDARPHAALTPDFVLRALSVDVGAARRQFRWIVEGLPPPEWPPPRAPAIGGRKVPGSDPVTRL